MIESIIRRALILFLLCIPLGILFTGISLHLFERWSERELEGLPLLSCAYLRGHLTVGAPLGTGGYKSVFAGRLELPSGTFRDVAVKYLRWSNWECWIFPHFCLWQLSSELALLGSLGGAGRPGYLPEAFGGCLLISDSFAVVGRAHGASIHALLGSRAFAGDRARVRGLLRALVDFYEEKAMAVVLPPERARALRRRQLRRGVTGAGAAAGDLQLAFLDLHNRQLLLDEASEPPRLHLVDADGAVLLRRGGAERMFSGLACRTDGDCGRGLPPEAGNFRHDITLFEEERARGFADQEELSCRLGYCFGFDSRWENFLRLLNAVGFVLSNLCDPETTEYFSAPLDEIHYHMQWKRADDRIQSFDEIRKIVFFNDNENESR